MDQEAIRNARAEAVADCLAHVRTGADIQTEEMTREGLADILAQLKTLAARHELWSEEDFPCSDPISKQSRYLVWEDPDHLLALYMIVWEPGKTISPHNHTTWACIAGISGSEENLLYERTDDRSVPGYAKLHLVKTVEVGAGGGIAMLPDDIHGVRIVGDTPARTLHLYGRALEVLTERVSYDVENNSYDIKSIGVTSIRALV